MAVRRSLAATGLAAALLVGLPGVAAGASAAGGADRLYPPDARPAGRTYEAIAARYMQWALEIPRRVHPALNPDSRRNCAVHGPFVFMGPVGTGDGCTVPGGKLVVLSFAAYECSTAEGHGRTWQKLRRCARGTYIRVFNRFVFKFRMRVDGALVRQPRRWTFTAANRVVDLPERNLFGAPAGPTRSVSHGLFFVLAPMPAGEHVVRARGKDWDLGRFDWAWRFTVE